MWRRIIVCAAAAAMLTSAGCRARSEADTLQTRAERGDAKAQYALGLCYYNGNGVIKNYVEAYKWFLLAGASKPGQFDEACTTLAKKMTAAQIAKAQAQANEWQQEHEQSCPAKK